MLYMNNLNIYKQHQAGEDCDKFLLMSEVHSEEQDRRCNLVNGLNPGVSVVCIV